jgi:hypothetical protein
MSKSKKRYTGINIQFPISSLILSGTKTIETRHYPLPKKYINEPLVVIETPGLNGNFKARMVAFITFGESFLYETADKFYKDTKLHHVTKESPWRWVSGKKKYGWPILTITLFKSDIPAPKKKGIKFTLDVKV